MSNTRVFNYQEITNIYNQMNQIIGDSSDPSTIAGLLHKIDEDYHEVVNGPAGEDELALRGDLAMQLLNNWENTAGSFPSFVENFSSWSTLVAQTAGDYSAFEEQVRGIRSNNPLGWNTGGIQNGYVASSSYTNSFTDEQLDEAAAGVQMYNLVGAYYVDTGMVSYAKKQTGWNIFGDVLSVVSIVASGCSLIKGLGVIGGAAKGASAGVGLIDDGAKAGGQLLLESGDDAARAGGRLLLESGDDAARAGGQLLLESGDDAARAGGQILLEGGDDAARAGGQLLLESGDDAARAGAQTATEFVDDGVKAGAQSASDFVDDGVKAGSQYSSEWDDLVEIADDGVVHDAGPIELYNADGSYAGTFVDGKYSAGRTFTHKVGDYAHKATDAIKNGASKTGTYIKNGASKAGTYIKNGASKAGTYIKNAGVAIKDGVSTAGTWVKENGVTVLKETATNLGTSGLVGQGSNIAQNAVNNANIRRNAEMVANARQHFGNNSGN